MIVFCSRHAFTQHPLTTYFFPHYISIVYKPYSLLREALKYTFLLRGKKVPRARVQFTLGKSELELEAETDIPQNGHFLDAPKYKVEMNLTVIRQTKHTN